MSDASVNAAYGLTITGLEPRSDLRLNEPVDWPALHVSQTSQPYPGEDHGVTEDGAVLRRYYGTMTVVREPASLTVHTQPTMSEDDLVHPCLWAPAAIFARWHGHETVHGGGFLDDDGAAWVVVGDTADGKTTLLAGLALAGRAILADDLIVLDGKRCLAGPRCLDLRPETVQALDVAERTTPVRATERGRLHLPPIAPSAPLRGFVCLGWGQRLHVSSVPASDRLGVLAGQRRVVELGADPLHLLRLASVPMLRFVRPHALDGLAEGCEELVRSANRHAPASA